MLSSTVGSAALAYARRSAGLLFAATILLVAPLALFTTLAERAPEVFPITEAKSDRAAKRGEIANGYGKLPLSFASNLGQSDGRVRFAARGLDYSLFLTADEAVFALHSSSRMTVAREGVTSPDADGKGSAHSPDALKVLRMKLLGANRKAKISGLDELPGKLNYFIGNDPRKWRKNIPTYSQVQYRNAYPGIDLVYHGNQQQLEYDFLIAPGASPGRIRLAFAGVQKTAIDGDGSLVLSTAAGDVRQPRPIAYQEFNGERREVAVNYKLNKNQVTFEIGAYDKNQRLIIDPVFVYSTFLGGNGYDLGNAIAVDAQGNAYLTGYTESTNFPLAGAFQSTLDTFDDAFVVKLNPAGTALVYGTYLGGDGDDFGYSIAVDAQGSAYVVGFTGSASFPVTMGAFQAAKASSFVDGFVTKLSPSGSSLSYSTFLGGENSEDPYGVAVDGAGRAYVVGSTDSTRFGTVPFSAPRNGRPTYKSTDGAGNWSPSDSGLTASIVNTFAIDPGNSNIIYAATSNGVFKSIDAAAHWNLTGVSNPASAPQFAYTVAIDPSNTSIVYVGASNGLYKSTDGGTTYAEKDNGMGGTVNALAIDPTTPTTLYASPISSSMFKSTDGGDNWVAITNGIGFSLHVNKVVIDPTNTATVYIGTRSGMFKTTNGGSLWTEINTGISSAPVITSVAIDPVHPATLYAGANMPQVVYKTTNGGANWSPSATGLPYSIVKSFAVDPITPTTIYAATDGAGIMKSIDAGANWNNTNLPISAANDVVVDRNNPATVYAGTAIGADVFAVRFNPSGSALEYLANFGGSENDEAHGVALGADDSAYIVGFTSSRDFPVVNAFQSVSGGFQDAFVTKLNPSGAAMVYSTYLGGSAFDYGRAVAVRAGSAYVVGETSSDNFPVVSPIQPGPFGFDRDAFVTKVNSSGASLDFSTCFGGTSFEQGFGLALDASGNVYVTGATFSSDFPTVAAPQESSGGSLDAFVTELNAAGSAFVYSTYLGGSRSDQGNGIAVDASGNAYVIGTTSSSNFPTVGAFQSTRKGTADAFITKLGVGADVSIAKKDSRDPVMINNPLTYTLNVSNAGPSIATTVTVTDVLPAGLTFGSAATTQGSCSFSSGTVTCNVGTLSASASAVITIAVTPTTIATISNTATVVALETDDIPANNSATELTTISNLPSINGHVRDANALGVNGVLVTLSGTQSATTQTDSSGFYQFANLPAGGMFTVTPSKANLSFSPPAQTFSPLNTDQTADFLASTCTFSIAPTNQSFGAGGGAGSVNVTTLQGCSWTAVSASTWITITSGASGVGNGAVNFTVSPTGAPRAGHITIAGQNFAVYQEFNSCGTPTFSVANYNLGNFPTVVRVADLDGDGHLDIVEASVGGLTSGGGIVVAVLRNSAAGTFTQSNFNTGLGGLTGMAVADFNSDNRPDIAFTNFNSLFVRIFFNDGSGGFGQPPVDLPLGSQPTQGLFASDLNHDGRTDLLVSAFNTNFVQVLLADGSGGFTQTNLTIGPGYGVLDTGDVNNDGNPDLLLGGTTTSSSMGVMLGNGSGGFGAMIVATGITGLVSPAIGDFDGDGKVDIAGGAGVVVPPSTVVPAVVVMSGDGAGHFTLKSTFSIDRVSGLTSADFNGDGKLDVAFTRYENYVTVLLGDGLGALGSPIQITTVSNNFGDGNYGIIAADLVGDSKPDLAVANYNYASSVLRNTCAAAPSISGRITDSRNTGGVEGVAITLGPLQVIRTYTDSNGNYFIGDLTSGGNYEVIPSKENFKFSPSSITVNNLTGSQIANFVGTPTVVQFTQIHYLVEENTASVQINVSRTGDLSGVTTVHYTTVNGTASDRSDFTAAVGTLHFSPGEALKSFNVLLTDDALVEGYESLRLVLSDASGALLATPQTDGLPSDVLMEIHDNDVSSGAPNPIGNSQFFVRQHYHDFLSREPDSGGLQFWVDQIESCGSDTTCREVKRINVSAAFFLSIEFQETGYLAYRFYNAAYGETTSPNVAGTVPIVRLQDFLPDTQQIGQGVQVGIGNWQQQLEDNKIAYALDFVQRQRFLTAFPLTMTAQEFVAKLDQNTNGVLSADEKSQLIAMLVTTPADAQKRSVVVRRVAEDSDLRQRELNRAFVLMQFYGYLRRNPDDPQDTDFRGWKFWLDKLNQFNGNFVDAEMVKAFLVAGEYRQRFGTP